LEIKGYFTKFCEKHELGQYIQLSHRVQQANWIESDGEWEIEVLDVNSARVFQNRCHILIHACGYLNNPSFPSIPGRYDFQGEIVHTGCWDKSLELTGKTVALLGSG
jgi:cation diffusion facilitator CzcD-associated flavoprotein CzcO